MPSLKNDTRIQKCWTFLLFCLLSPSLFAIYRAEKRSFYLYFAGNLLYTSTEADKVLGATYTDKYTNPIIAVFGLGFLASENIYVGARYEYWTAGRKYTLNELEEKDTLTYYTLGLDGGYLYWSEKLFVFLLGGFQYPMALRVTSKSSVYEPASKPIAFQVRAAIGVNFAVVYSMLLEIGYRIQSLGKLATSSGTNYIEGSDFNLSSPYLGVGLWFHF